MWGGASMTDLVTPLLLISSRLEFVSVTHHPVNVFAMLRSWKLEVRFKFLQR